MVDRLAARKLRLDRASYDRRKAGSTITALRDERLAEALAARQQGVALDHASPTAVAAARRAVAARSEKQRAAMVFRINKISIHRNAIVGKTIIIKIAGNIMQPAQ